MAIPFSPLCPLIRLRLTPSVRPGLLNTVTRPPSRTLLTLAIESSCDDTSVAILHHFRPGDEAIRFIDRPDPPATHLFFHEKITSNNLAYGGVSPIVALESHQDNVAMLVKKAWKAIPRRVLVDSDTARCRGTEGDAEGKEVAPLLDFISVTRGPGMRSNVAVGLDTAKGLAVALDVPLLGVNHMQAHALTPRLCAALEPVQSPDQTSTTSRQAPSLTPRNSSKSENEERIQTDDTNTPTFPFLTLLVSGGHTMLINSSSLVSHRNLATTTDKAIGNAIDRMACDIVPSEILAQAETAMYGPVLERFAFPNGQSDYDYPLQSQEPQEIGNEKERYVYNPPTTRAAQLARRSHPAYDWSVSPPLSGGGAHRAWDMEYSFSGIQTTVQNIVLERPDMGIDERRALARIAMETTFEHLASRVALFLEGGRSGRKFVRRREGEEAAGADLVVAKEADGQDLQEASPTNPTVSPSSEFPSQAQADKISTLVVSGGVAANHFLRFIFREYLSANGHGDLKLVFPPLPLCTDNAAMIAWAGMEMYMAGYQSKLSCRPLRKWGLDPDGSDGGILGVGGWERIDGREVLVA